MHTDSSPLLNHYPDGMERRDQNRQDVELVIDIESESNFFTGFSENISEGGLFIATYDYKPLGTQLNLKFQLPDSTNKIEVIGEVCWIRAFNPVLPDMVPGMGVKFLNLDQHQEQRVQSFCKQLREPLFIDLDF